MLILKKLFTKAVTKISVLKVVDKLLGACFRRGSGNFLDFRCILGNKSGQNLY